LAEAEAPGRVSGSTGCAKRPGALGSSRQET